MRVSRSLEKSADRCLSLNDQRDSIIVDLSTCGLEEYYPHDDKDSEGTTSRRVLALRTAVRRFHPDTAR